MITFNHATQSVVDGVDHRCRELDRKWGIGRLPLLVDDELRARFRLQQQMFNDAICSGDEEQVALHGNAMRRGWDALDAAATAAGAEPLRPEVWETTLPDSGEVVAIVRTDAEAYHVCRDCEVYTLTEIGQLIEKLGSIRKIKTSYPGATVAEVRDKPLGYSKQEREARIAELAAQFDARGPDDVPFE
jgi:hypothetical protein